MKVILQRNLSDDKATTGQLSLTWMSSQPKLYTIERPWKENERNVSSIPAGTYTCVPHIAKTKKGGTRKTWQLQSVPNRDGINFDIANRAHEVKGCIAVGFGLDATVPMVSKSADAMGYLLTQIGDKTTFEIEIKDYVAAKKSDQSFLDGLGRVADASSIAGYASIAAAALPLFVAPPVAVAVVGVLGALAAWRKEGGK